MKRKLELIQQLQEAVSMLMNSTSESLRSQILKKDAEEHPNKHMISKERMEQYDKADNLRRKAYSQVVKSAGGLRNYLESGRGTTKNKEGEMKTDWRRGPFTQDQVEYNRMMDPNKERAVEKSKARHAKKVNEALELIQQLQEAVSMLNEVVDEKEVNKIKREKKDKKGNTVEVVSVEDELFPKEGNAKEQYNQKVIDIINQMIEGKATLEDLLQFVRGQKAASKKKAVANESLERVEEAISNAIQVISEVSSKFTGKRLAKAQAELDNLTNKVDNEENPEKKEELETQEVKLKHKLNPTRNHVENYHIKQEENKKK